MKNNLENRLRNMLRLTMFSCFLIFFMEKISFGGSDKEKIIQKLNGGYLLSGYHLTKSFTLIFQLLTQSIIFSIIFHLIIEWNFNF
ncbi:hypothetical protein LguiA_016539 [Lonicera macranthoides]